MFREGGKEHTKAGNLFLLRETSSVRIWSSVLFSYCGYRLISLFGWFYRFFFYCGHLQIFANSS